MARKKGKIKEVITEKTPCSSVSILILSDGSRHVIERENGKYFFCADGLTIRKLNRSIVTVTQEELPFGSLDDEEIDVFANSEV